MTTQSTHLFWHAPPRFGLLSMRDRAMPYQKGVTLVMTLIVLVLVTLLAATVIESVTLQEKSSGSQRNQELAFQAAESGKKFCRTWIDNYLNPAKLNETSQTGATQIWLNQTYWNDPTKTVVYGSQNIPGYNPINGVTAQPVCLIESLDINPGPTGKTTGNKTAYRVTVRGTGGSSDALVTLQYVYAPN